MILSVHCFRHVHCSARITFNSYSVEISLFVPQLSVTNRMMILKLLNFIFLEPQCFARQIPLKIGKED